MSVCLLRAADRVPTAWRNGGGVTREIAARPLGATLEEFDWRVSMAEVRSAGPFSRFPGVDRVLTVVEGTLSLAIAGRAAVMLSAESLPFCFAGDDACAGEPLGGPVIDLNVMVRRGRFCCDVRRISNTRLAMPAATCLVVALLPGRVTLGTDEWHLATSDALLLQDVGGAALAAEGVLVSIGLSGR